jgi:hypothetical protein
MWVFTTIGFFSIVADRYDKEGRRLMVRARAKKDLERLQKQYLHDLTIVDSTREQFQVKDGKGGHYYRSSDYPYRAFVTRRALANAMRRMVMDLVYTNFKSEVMKIDGSVREGVYMDVWSTMRAAEDKGKLNGTYKPRPFKSYSGGRSSSQLSFGDTRYDLPPSLMDHFMGGGNEPELDPEEEEAFLAEHPEMADPFFWRDGEGHTSDDADPDDEDEERRAIEEEAASDAPMEFDSIEDVLAHFRTEGLDDGESLLPSKAAELPTDGRSSWIDTTGGLVPLVDLSEPKEPETSEPPPSPKKPNPKSKKTGRKAKNKGKGKKK